MSCGDQVSSSYCLFEVFPDLRRWQTVIRKSQPATEDENAGRSTHCVFVLGRNDRHFVSGRTNQRVSYAPGKGNRYPPSKDSSHNRRIGNPPFKVKTSVCLRDRSLTHDRDALNGGFPTLRFWAIERRIANSTTCVFIFRRWPCFLTER